MMGTDITEIDAAWAEKRTKTRVPFLSAPSVLHLANNWLNPGNNETARKVAQPNLMLALGKGLRLAGYGLPLPELHNKIL